MSPDAASATSRTEAAERAEPGGSSRHKIAAAVAYPIAAGQNAARQSACSAISWPNTCPAMPAPSKPVVSRESATGRRAAGARSVT